MTELKAIELTPEQTKKLQEELLEILIEFDRICRKRNIPYFLYGGTLLGAVRHKGFIPWDDDIDVAMLRKDYNEFKKVVNEELNTEKFFFQTQETDKNYNWVFGRLRKQNTLFIRYGQQHLNHHNGIFLDVFPLDNISESRMLQKTTIFMAKFCKRILWSSVGKKQSDFIITRYLYTLLDKIPKKMIVELFELFAISNRDTSLLVGHSISHAIFQRKWLDTSCELEFEGYKYYVPFFYNKILKDRYGNYLELPPEEERRGHHYVSYIMFSDGEEIK